MRLLAARLKNFKSFREEQHFQFPQGPGLYFMRGINEVEPRLGGNGVGKTTLWDALLWCIHGKTAKGLKAGDVCNWDADKGTEVSFDFVRSEDDACVWTVSRTWGPITWTLSHLAEYITDEEVVDLTKDESNVILQELRLEFEPFLQSILMAQGRPMFLDLKPDAQASLFSNVLGLERWMDYSARASKNATVQDGKSRELESRLAKLQGELEAVSRQDLSKTHDEWEIENAKKLLRVEADHAEGIKKRKRLKEDLGLAQEAEQNSRALVAKNQPDAGLAKDLGTFRGYVADYTTMKRDAERDLEKERRHHDGMEAGNCPTCGQKLHKEEAVEHRWKARKRVEKLEGEVKRWGKELDASQKRLAELEEQHAAQAQELEAARDQLDAAQREVSGARRALELQDRELDRLEDLGDEIAGAKNPYAGMAQEARRKAQELRSQVGATQGALDASYALHGLLSYWVRGFKEIRLQEIAHALTELEIEVNSAVTALGLVDWELRFQVDKEGKGGGVQRGFNVLVKSPHNPRPTPWEAWSGGEAQRLRLAGNWGLADLIRSRTGTTLNMEVWDEPTNGLSPEGIQDLLEGLETRARNEGRQIFVVDHRAFDFGGFAGTATVIKAPSGSRIRTTW